MEVKLTLDPVGNSVSKILQERIVHNAEYATAVGQFAFSENVAQMIIGYRMENNLTQRECAAIVEMSTSVISRLENGEHSASGDIVSRLCKALGIKIESCADTHDEGSLTRLHEI